MGMIQFSWVHINEITHFELLGTSPVSHWCGSPRVLHSFRNPLSIELGMPVASVKLNIERKFFRDANQSWANKESCCTARLAWSLMDRRHTNQLFGLGRDVISITMAVFTGHWVMGKLTERTRLPINDFCRRCRSAKEEETVIHFLCLLLCKLFGSPFLISLTDLSSIDVKDIPSFIKHSDSCFWCDASIAKFFTFHDFGETWLVQWRDAIRAQVNFMISKLPLRRELEPKPHFF